MLIIPTEKRFDWQHTPVVLSLIVLVNCLVFFLYQSGDTAKFYEAVGSYQQKGYFEKEWPAFKAFLKEGGETEALTEYRQLYNDKFFSEIAFDMLQRDDFYRYVDQHRFDILSYQQAQNWQAERKAIKDRLDSISAVSLGLIPSKLSPLTLLSHQFLHGDTMHLLGNMFFLIICGFAVEAAIGHLRFLLFYLISGVSGGALYSVLDLSSTTPLVGASGAISGVMAMYVAAFRLKKIEFFYWFYVFVGYIRAPALVVLPLYIGMELYDYCTNTDSNVAYLAHVGGFLGGAILIGGAWALNRDIFNRDYIETDQSVDPVQEKLAKVYSLMEKYRFRSALTALNELIAEHGSSFELEKLRYHLIRPTQADDFIDCARAILQLHGRGDRDLALIDELWRATAEYHDTYSEDDKLKLGLKLATPEYWASAENIFEMLQANQCKPNSLGILARKLSVCFKELGNKEKMRRYDRIADTIAMGGMR